ncbi:MAG TPA: aldolase/citrate lyase family protein [Candidatus Limnocylindrales bacterium]
MSDTHAVTTPSLPPRGDLRRRVLAGEPSIGAWVNLGSVVSAELVARAGFDWVVLDLEHGMGSEADIHPQLLAVQGTPTAALVRPASSERLRVGRALDLGADGLVVPRLETPAEVAETLAWMRYPPAGTRGVALTTRGGGYFGIAHPDLASSVNERLLGVFQVESPVAVAAADELAAIDGVDVLFVGPADLSHAMAMPGRFAEPAFTDALDRVVAACRANGKAAGILLADASLVPAYLERGFTFLGVGSDSGWVVSGAAAQVAAGRAALA